MKTFAYCQFLSGFVKSCLLITAFLTISTTLLAQITLNIDPTQVVGLAKPNHYAINKWQGMDSAVASHADYQARIKELNPKLVRYHAAEQMKCKQGKRWIDGKSWINCSKQEWDANHIQKVLSHTAVSGVQIVINISTYPEWIASPNIEAYAQFCADLVRIVNVDLGMGVKYWEPINEWNIKGYNGIEIADHYIACYQAMKAVDPSIKLCGPVSTHPQDGTILPFLEKLRDTGTPLDLFTYHQYQFGNTDDPSPAEIYERSNSFVDGIRIVRDKLDATGFEDIEIFVDEWNIFWAYDAAGNQHMTSEVGACFDALVLKHIIEESEGLKLFGMAAWEDAGGSYGKIKQDFSGMNPGGHLLQLLNAHGVGEAVGCSSSRSAAVEGFAVKRNDGTLMIAVINRALDGDRNVHIATDNWKPAGDLNDVTKYVINSYGLSTDTVSWDAITNETFRIGESDVVVFVTHNTNTPETTFPDPDKWYHVENVGHTKYLQGTSSDDLTGTSCGPTAQNVRGVDTYKTGSWTQWKFIDAGEGQYYLKNKGHNMHLQVSNAPDITINSNECGGDKPLTVRMADQSCRGDWVKWELIETSNGTYHLRNTITNTYLQALGVPDWINGSSEGGVQLRQVAVDCDGGWTQWRLVETGTNARARQANASYSKLSLPTSNAEVSIYPNPATTVATITVPALSVKQVNVEVYKASGRLLTSQELTVSGSQVQLSTESWREGLYLVSIKSHDAVYQARLLVE